eukprot:15437605-Alexandrium_andersonii.AAC.1
MRPFGAFGTTTRLFRGPRSSSSEHLELFFIFRVLVSAASAPSALSAPNGGSAPGSISTMLVSLVTPCQPILTHRPGTGEGSVAPSHVDFASCLCSVWTER